MGLPGGFLAPKYLNCKAKAGSMANVSTGQSGGQKKMTSGEMGTAIALAALALLSILVSAKATDPGYAFHAALFTIASAAGVFFIVNRYMDRPASSASGRD